jgi:Zn-dependent protease with chaperone function
MSNINFSEITAIPLEEALRNQIHNALQGDIITSIIKEAKFTRTDNYWRQILEGHSFKIEENVSNKFYTMCHEVKEQIGFNEPIDFYITNNPDVNAFASSRIEDDEAHIININSGLLQLMTDEEMKFVIGHEIGHLISKNAELWNIIHFVFPPSSKIPALLTHKIRLWKQLSELIADRFGFIACPDTHTCISAFFKMSSGMNPKWINLDIKAFLEENEQRLDYFRNDNGLSISTHPITPIRIKAIELFAKSSAGANISNTNPAINDETYSADIESLIEILLKIRNSKLDIHITQFIATAGLIVANIDDEVSREEIEHVIKQLSNFTIFPKRYLEYISQQDDIHILFGESVKSILEINPGERHNLLHYLISLVIADRNIDKQEVDFVFMIGEQMFGFSRKEIAQIFATVIQENYLPSVNDLS